MVADYRRRFWVSLAVTLPILALSPLIQQALGLADALAFPGSRWVLLLLASFVYGYGGWPFLSGLVRELRERNPGMMTLVGMAISVAYFYSTAVVFGVSGKLFFWETVTLIDLMLVGHWVEMRSVMGAGQALEALVKLMPAEAQLLESDGSTREVKIAELRPGDRVRVRPGEKVPADGEIVEGHTLLDESMLTGESRPVEKGPRDAVIAGAVNGSGALVVIVRKTGADSYLAQVVELVRNAQSSRSRIQNLADRAAFYLTVSALAAGALTFGVWLGLAGATFVFTLERAITVMVIACPHALGLAIPLVVAVSTNLSARNGLLIRDRAAFERARAIDTVVFDKTGTLTEGRFGVTGIIPLGEASEEEVLRLAAAVELSSEHPIAQGILRAAEERGLQLPEAIDFQSLAGRGARALVDGEPIRVLSAGAMREEGLALHGEASGNGSGSGRTEVYVVRGETSLGAIYLDDIIRPESREAVDALHAFGVRVVILTGDKREVADWVAEELGVDEVIAEVLPHQKSAHIEALKQQGRTVAMTGDGVNDAPALATADVGLAIGAGTDVAIATADVVLVRSDPRDVVTVLRLSRATYRKMLQNLWYAAGYNIVAIPLAAGVLAWAGVLLVPAAGAVLMSLSTVVVAINARFLKLA
ncbi:MAG: copper-translocating P-type ATPase [SAR324 cluster bacterium]|nr:copper-translocating P-type ATPase [SAR324 cluster bacterium]